MDKFISRAISTAILIAAITVVVYLFPNWIFALVVALFIALGQYELFQMVEKKGLFVYKYFGMITGSLIPIVIYIGSTFADIKNLEPLLIVIASLFALILQFIRRDETKDHLVSMAVTLFSLFYIGWFFSFLVKLKLLDNGANLVAFLIFATKSADIGAYLIGRTFGRTSLIPRISPNKTIEGTIGGILVGVIFAVTAGKFLTDFSTLHLAVLGVVLAVLGLSGDLAESLIKRDCGVKDSGTTFAGIGGALDLVDSLLFTVPVFYIYVKIF